MTKPASQYSRDGVAGINNPVLQKSVKMLQSRFGRGALQLWAELEDQELRGRAKSQRMRTLANLDVVLAELARKVRAAGGHVFFAKTAEDAVEYTRKVCAKHQVKTVVKGKSMTTMEVGVDGPLENDGIEIVETDLGEYIIQLAEELPSHIIAPCIHMDRQTIGELFSEKLGNDYTEDPPELTQIARKSLREKFLAADMGLTGCNLACAETGQISLVSNEGNIRMSTTLPKVHVAFMGMERVTATFEEHRELLQLLTRGAALQDLSTYVSYIGGPSAEDDPDGSKEFHLVIIDNGRSKILADDTFKEVLACIRCGACLNICPVYRKIGGHAYHKSPYCGPIGAVVTPLLEGINQHADLCKGETLCGACKTICPVENDLPRMLSELRFRLAYGDEYWGVKPHKKIEHFGFKQWQRLISSKKLYALSLATARKFQRFSPTANNMITKLPWLGSRWTDTRDIPPIAEKTFSERWQQRQKTKSDMEGNNE